MRKFMETFERFPQCLTATLVGSCVGAAFRTEPVEVGPTLLFCVTLSAAVSQLLWLLLRFREVPNGPT